MTSKILVNHYDFQMTLSYTCFHKHHRRKTPNHDWHWHSWEPIVVSLVVGLIIFYHIVHMHSYVAEHGPQVDEVFIKSREFDYL